MWLGLKGKEAKLLDNFLESVLLKRSFLKACISIYKIKKAKS